MATVADWLEGARVRTLPASIAPVLIGAGIAIAEGGFSWVRTLLAIVVALALQIGVNFANDYSDGVRGTDEFRSGPPRLTGGGKASPRLVKTMAFVFFGLAAVAGLALVALSGKWWLLGAGVAAVAAAWFYTGGKNPYGYLGLGEVFVMIFFGYLATIGTVYTQTGTAPWEAWVAGTGVGLIACALLMVNNVRDIPTDTQAGKKTLAVRLGDANARRAYVAMLVVAIILGAAIALRHPGAAAVLVLAFWVWPLSRQVLSGASGHALLPVLRNTGLLQLSYGLILLAAFCATALIS
ncbi:MAG: 1,4-dihydroxy-2-naphthoate polyprenyltransferase [Trueperella sp.]|nr:1,4-dihydroxy-2-naphthoate polyprenyltransferase [Trueperella sp.]